MDRESVLQLIQTARHQNKTPDLRRANLSMIDLSKTSLRGVDLGEGRSL